MPISSNSTKYIDADNSVLYLVTFLDNRQFYMSGHNEMEVLHKVENYFEGSTYSMREPILSIVMKTVKVERTEIKWPT